MIKAVSESRRGKISVFLVPARTGSKWFHELVIPCAKEIRFLRGRLKFKSVNHKGGTSAPFDSMVVIF